MEQSRQDAPYTIMGYKLHIRYTIYSKMNINSTSGINNSLWIIFEMYYYCNFYVIDFLFAYFLPNHLVTPAFIRQSKNEQFEGNPGKLFWDQIIVDIISSQFSSKYENQMYSRHKGLHLERYRRHKGRAACKCRPVTKDGDSSPADLTDRSNGLG